MSLPGIRNFRKYLCVVLLAGSALPAFAQQQGPDANGPRSIAALRMADDERLRMDGRLDEPFWRRAQPAADFIQVDPNNGVRVTEPTEVRIAFDRDTIYIGVTCFDSEPDGWLGY